MTKILHVTLGYYPSNHWGGIATVVETLSVAQQELGHEVRISCANLSRPGTTTFDSQNGYASAAWRNVRCDYLDVASRPIGKSTVGPTLLSRKSLARLASAMDWADVVHIHGGRNAMCVSALTLARRMGSKAVVYQPHGGLGRIGVNVRVKRIFDLGLDLLIRSVDPIIVVLSPSEEALIRMRFKRADIRLFNNPVRPLDVKQNDDWPPGRPVISFVGRLNWKKGPDLLLEAFHAVNATGSILRFIGPDDGMETELRQRSEELGIEDSVVFTGPLDSIGLAKELQQATLLVHPARTDTFPMAILETICAARPTIISSEVEAAEALAHLCRLAEPNPSKIADAIATVLSDLDEECEIASRNAAQAREQFGAAKIAEDYVTTYKDRICD